MKKLIFANNFYKLLESNELFENFRRLKTSEILVTTSLPLPRDRDTDFHKAMFPLPDINNFSNISFAEATDSRVNEIIAYARSNELPIVVYWSGGIDSTVMLSAIIKHFPPDLLKRVSVWMTNASYIENPDFFKNVINKNNIAYTQYKEYDYTNAIILHGDPADSLWPGGAILNISANTPDIYKQNIIKDNTDILRHYANLTDSNYAEWLYDYVLTSAINSNIKVTTYSDFLWWLIFNFSYPSMCLKHAGELAVTTSTSAVSFNSYKQNFLLWYDTTLYQVWSIQAQYAGSKFDGTVRSYKMEAKEYIYEYDKNQWYRDYKTKIHSHYSTSIENNRISAIYEDGEIILNGRVS